jgi:RNA polymerase sigma factor (sigma-70 family)
MAENPLSAGPIRIEDHMGLLCSCVLKFVRSGPVEDSELYSVGCLALMEAARTFDPSRSKFCTWATRIIMQRLVDEFHRNSRSKESCSPDLDSRPEEDRESFPLHLLPEILGDECDERSMVVGHYLEGKSLSDLGREFGYSKEWIRKKIRSAVSKMRRDNRALLGAYL